MIKATDFEGFKQKINMAWSGIRDKTVNLDAKIDIFAGEVSYVVTDSDNHSKEYNSLEPAIVMYNKMIGE